MDFHGEDINKQLTRQTLETKKMYLSGLSNVLMCSRACSNSTMLWRIKVLRYRHGIQLRDMQTLFVVPQPTVECFKQSFKFAGGKVWNRPYALTSFNRHLRGKTVTKQSKRTDLCARRTGLANEQPPFDL